MVFYVIAAGLPSKDENDNQRDVKASLRAPSGRELGQVFDVAVSAGSHGCRWTSLNSKLARLIR